MTAPRRCTARLLLPLVAAIGLAGGLAGCAGGLGGANQVIVRLDENPNDLVAAQRVADDACRRRGQRARFVVKVTNYQGTRDSVTPLPPDAIFACDPPA